MRYRIFEREGMFNIQRKMAFRWVWYCGAVFGWSNYWGEKEKSAYENRCSFFSLDEAFEFIAKEKNGLDNGTLITSDNIENYLKDNNEQ